MKLTHRIKRYGVITTGAFLFDILLLSIVLLYTHIPYYFAAPGVFLIARTVAYIFNRIWAFSDTEEKVHTSYGYYIGFSLLGAVVVLFGVVALVELLQVQTIIARILVGAVIILMGYLLNHKVVFRVS